MDTVLITAKKSLESAYGPGADAAVPGGWQQWLAQILAMLTGGCPTPASAKQFAGSLWGEVKMYQAAHRLGIYGAKATKVVVATQATIAATPDTDVQTVIDAAAA